jgi:hypothetical protein
MRIASALALACLLALGAQSFGALEAQTKPSGAQKAWSPTRTIDGQPDLQGVWDFSTVTPMERPVRLGDKAFFLNDQEAAEFEREEIRFQNRDLIDPEKGGAVYPAGGVVPYNEFWYERGTKVIGSRRTSLIVDPPNGRMPVMTPEGRRKADARAKEGLEDQLGRGRADSWEDRSLPERCIMGFNAGPPITPSAYNNNLQIFQGPGYVVILTEMIHDARVIPLNGRSHLPPDVRQLKGDSRGRWDGNTLVIETTNFTRETSLPGSTQSMHLVERLTRADENTLLYEFTVNDPATWTRPWTAQVPMKKSNERIYEYACHEGNTAMEGILGGARAAEKAAGGKSGK